MTNTVNIYDALNRIRERKAMYLGNEYTFQSLNGFILGFDTAANPEQLTGDKFPSFNFFSIWLLGHLDKNYGLAGGWHWQIHNRNLNDDENAFKEFFEFLDIFKNSELSTKTILVDNEARTFYKSNDYNYSNLEKTEDFNLRVTPKEIIWESLTNSTTVWIKYVDDNGEKYKEEWYVNPSQANKALKSKFNDLKISG